jgi:hypothetical protein
MYLSPQPALWCRDGHWLPIYVLGLTPEGHLVFREQARIFNGLAIMPYDEARRVLTSPSYQRCRIGASYNRRLANR